MVLITPLPKASHFVDKNTNITVLCARKQFAFLVFAVFQFPLLINITTIILGWILERWDGVMWTGLVWLRIGTGGELL
jgi:hypothetical protein